MARHLARAARWSLPVALIVAALVALGGLGAMLFAPTADAPAAPAALDLTRPSDAATGLVPQDAPGAQPGCPPATPPPCPSATPSRLAPSGCCR